MSINLKSCSCAIVFTHSSYLLYPVLEVTLSTSSSPLVPLHLNCCKVSKGPLTFMHGFSFTCYLPPSLGTSPTLLPRGNTQSINYFYLLLVVLVKNATSRLTRWRRIVCKEITEYCYVYFVHTMGSIQSVLCVSY